jgi:hypothetical protein
MSYGSYRRLELATSLADITELGVQAYQNEVPGFQVDEAVLEDAGMLAVTNSIEVSSELVLGSRIPFTYMSRVPYQWRRGMSSRHYAPHIDPKYRGLVVHNELEGEGYVELAHSLDDAHTGDNDIWFTESGLVDAAYDGGGLGTSTAPVDVVYGGELTPGKLTVFSEGNIEGLKPTIHLFRRNHGFRFDWRKYGSRQDDAKDDATTLAAKADNYKLGVQWIEFQALLARFEMEGGVDKELDRQLREHPGRHIVMGSYSEILNQPELNERSKSQRITRALAVLARRVPRYDHQFNRDL